MAQNSHAYHSVWHKRKHTGNAEKKTVRKVFWSVYILGHEYKVSAPTGKRQRRGF